MVDQLVDALLRLKPNRPPSCWSSRISTWRRSVGDDVAVMDEGRIIHTGDMAALVADEALQHRLLGLSMAAAHERKLARALRRWAPYALTPLMIIAALPAIGPGRG